MKSALDVFQIEGIKHNIPFLRSVISNTRYVSGDLINDFIQEEVRIKKKHNKRSNFNVFLPVFFISIQMDMKFN